MKCPKDYENWIGRKVQMAVDVDDPDWYPKINTVGTIVRTDNSKVLVNWGKESGVMKNSKGKYEWYVTWNKITPVNFDMTDEEIWEMFKPKMKKLGINPEGEASFNELRTGKFICRMFKNSTVQKLVATAYRSGYGRGQKGRPFVIGEKKQKGHWEWIKPNEIVPDGTKVRYMKRAERDDGNDSYYPNIGQECIKLNAPGFSDTDFWVQFEGSEYKYTCLDSFRDCFQKWVEDDE